MKRILVCLLSIILLLSFVMPACAGGYTGEVEAKSAMLYNRDTGEVLFAKNSTGHVAPDRGAMLMTALLISENSDTPEDEMTVSLPTDAEERALMKTLLTPSLSDGETVTVRFMLEAILLQGADDAALAAARKIGGTVTRFTSMMNNRATELGMTGTLFKNPVGAADDDQYTSVSDMKKLLETALADRQISQILSMSGDLVLSGTGADRSLVNSNQLVGGDFNTSGKDDPSVTAGMGGRVTGSGGCMITLATRLDKNLACLLFGDESSGMDARIRNTLELFDFGGGVQTVVNLAELLENVPLTYTEGDSGYYIVTADIPNEEITLTGELESSDISVQVIRSKENISEGTAYYYTPDGRELAAVPVTIQRVRSEGEISGRRILGWIIGVLTVFMVIVLIVAIRRLYYTYRHQQRVRIGSRLEGAPEIPDATREVRNRFNYNFPVWSLFFLALIMLILIGLCFRLYKN